MDELYEKAMDAFQNHRWAEAEELFTQIEGRDDVAGYLKKCRMYRKFSVGNIVPYGTADGKEMTWQVLEERGNMRLLLCTELAASRPYRDQYIDTFWESSSLRKWLNSDFIAEHFSTEERRTIMSTRIETPINEDFATGAGPRTMDKVFILSKPELLQFLPEEKDRNMGTWWWVRTPGSSLLTTSIVYNDGSFYRGGVNVNAAGGGVRPAMWVLLKG